MKRDPRLRGLSSDHHHALVLARRLAARAAAGTADSQSVIDLRRGYQAVLAPHFAIEEEVLLPALQRAGEHAIVQRTLTDHAALRDHLEAAERGDLSRLAAFGALLSDHVRFEERELFAICEARLENSVLDEVARRSGPPDSSTP